MVKKVQLVPKLQVWDQSKIFNGKLQMYFCNAPLSLSLSSLSEFLLYQNSLPCVHKCRSSSVLSLERTQLSSVGYCSRAERLHKTKTALKVQLHSRTFKRERLFSELSAWTGRAFSSSQPKTRVYPTLTPANGGALPNSAYTSWACERRDQLLCTLLGSMGFKVLCWWRMKGIFEVSFLGSFLKSFYESIYNLSSLGQ